MSPRLGIVMDPISKIKIQKDSSFAMLLEATRRGWPLYYLEQNTLFVEKSHPYGQARLLQVFDDPHHWFTLGEIETIPLGELDVLLMRKDPPFDIEYIYTTYLLELAEKEGCLVVNKPQSLRDANEKFFTTWFPDCCPPTLVSRQPEKFRGFLDTHGDVVFKPLAGMGGRQVFHVKKQDDNTNVIIDTLTEEGHKTAMAQVYIPEIALGDKRILLIEGNPIDYGLARVPQPGDPRGNLAQGAKGQGFELTERDYWICEKIGPTLREKGLLFVGIDVIGDYLTEINITSPTCIREIDSLYGLNIAGTLFDAIEKQLNKTEKGS